MQEAGRESERKGNVEETLCTSFRQTLFLSALFSLARLRQVRAERVERGRILEETQRLHQTYLVYDDGYCEEDEDGMQ